MFYAEKLVPENDSSAGQFYINILFYQERRWESLDEVCIKKVQKDGLFVTKNLITL